MPLIQNPLIVAILPSLVIGILNGLYWRKKGHDWFRYSFLGSIIAYGLILTFLKYFRENF